MAKAERTRVMRVGDALEDGTNAAVCITTKPLEPVPYHPMFSIERDYCVQGENLSFEQGTVALPAQWLQCHLEWTLANSFVQAVLEAFRSHHGLVLTPDTVWHAMVSALMPVLRRFYDAQPGPATQADATFQAQDALPGDYAHFVTQFCNHVMPLEPDGVQAELNLRFSTTNSKIALARRIATVSLPARRYAFSGRFACGIPSVRLEGTADDWLMMSSSLERLFRRLDTVPGVVQESDVTWKMRMLSTFSHLQRTHRLGQDRPVGAVPADLMAWWQGMVQARTTDCDRVDDFDGWLVDFCNLSGERQSTDDIVSGCGTLKFNVAFESDAGPPSRRAAMVGGLVCFAVHPHERWIRPFVGYVAGLRIHTDSEEKERGPSPSVSVSPVE